MATKVIIMFPPGRWVSGDIYEKQTKDDAGPIAPEKQRVNFGYAIPKAGTTDWKTQTPWGQQIAAAAAADWPNGESAHDAFSFKVKDGDSTKRAKPNSKAAAEHEGWPGCWVAFFSSKYAAPIVNGDGTENFALRANKEIKKGDVIQVYGSCKGTNDRPANPGCYLNHDVIAFREKGKEIFSANHPDPTKLGFGGAPVQAAAVTSPAANPIAAVANATAQTAVVPHTAFLTPGAAPTVPTAPPVAPVRVMTAKAGALTYEAFIAQNWTDELLRSNGYMV